MCPAIHINSRSWLRSSSTHEPSDPPLRVVCIVCRSLERNPSLGRTARQGSGPLRRGTAPQVAMRISFASRQCRRQQQRRAQAYAWAIDRRAADSLSLARGLLHPVKRVDRNRHPRRCVRPLDDAEAVPCRRATTRQHFEAGETGTLARQKHSGQPAPSIRQTCRRCRNAASSRGITPDDACVAFRSRTERRPSAGLLHHGVVSVAKTSRGPASQIGNDPSAGSPTETLLRLLLPLDDQV